MNVINGWIRVAVNALSTLKMIALEQLLHSEKLVANAFNESKILQQAPAPSKTPDSYPILMPGQERKRQNRLGWWDRFQTADGFLPEMLRLLVAVAIIVSVLWAGATVGN